MSEIPEKTAFKKWLDQLTDYIKPTPKGVRLDLALYVYPDGHGNLYFRSPETRKLDAVGQPVNNSDEADDAFRSVWERATAHPK